MSFVHTHGKVIRRLSLALAISLGLATLHAAQTPSDRGTITGIVTDPLGAVAPTVQILAKSTEGDTLRRATSDGTGKYTLADLPLGSYDVSVSIPGLKAYERKNVRVQAATPVVVDIRLEEGSQLSTLGEDPLGIAADRARHNPPSGPTPQTADGKPDLSGVWWAPVIVEPGNPEWLPFAQRVAAGRMAENNKESPQARCLPSAVLRSSSSSSRRR